MSTIGVRS